jgi:hypothetical protein
MDDIQKWSSFTLLVAHFGLVFLLIVSSLECQSTTFRKKNNVSRPCQRDPDIPSVNRNEVERKRATEHRAEGLFFLISNSDTHNAPTLISMNIRTQILTLRASLKTKPTNL